MVEFIKQVFLHYCSTIVDIWTGHQQHHTSGTALRSAYRTSNQCKKLTKQFSRFTLHTCYLLLELNTSYTYIRRQHLCLKKQQPINVIGSPWSHLQKDNKVWPLTHIFPFTIRLFFEWYYANILLPGTWLFLRITLVNHTMEDIQDMLLNFITVNVNPLEWNINRLIPDKGSQTWISWAASLKTLTLPFKLFSLPSKKVNRIRSRWWPYLIPAHTAVCRSTSPWGSSSW